MAADVLAGLARELRPVRLRARERLFGAGEVSDRLFLVRSGRIEVLAEVDGEEGVVRVVGPGAVLGELGVLTGAPRSAAVRAVRDSELLELDAVRFTRVLEEQPALALGVARELARQLQASGGLLPPKAAPAIFAVVAPRLTPAVGRVWERLRDELQMLVPVTAIDGASAADDGAAQAAVVERIERAGRRVLLYATLEGGSPGWAGFCLRQADRVVFVAEGEPAADLEGDRCELLFAGAAAPEIDRWLDAVVPRAHHVVRDETFADDVARVARRLTGTAVGLVLSGGGARGFAHVGVYEVLHREGLLIDRVGGCSMGALVGCLVALGLPPDELSRAVRGELVNRSPFNDYTLPRIALIRARKGIRMLQRLFGDVAMEELRRPAFTVSADLLSSELVVHRRGPLWEAVAASISLPGLAPPRRAWGRLLVDGGVLNNLPVDTMAETHEGPIVAVDVIRRLKGSDDPDAKRVPSIVETIARATVLGSVERAEGNRSLAQLVIVPEVAEIGLRSWRAFDRAVAAGRRAAEEALAETPLQTLAQPRPAVGRRSERALAAAPTPG